MMDDKGMNIRITSNKYTGIIYSVSLDIVSNPIYIYFYIFSLLHDLISLSFLPFPSTIPQKILSQTPPSTDSQFPVNPHQMIF